MVDLKAGATSTIQLTMPGPDNKLDFKICRQNKKNNIKYNFPQRIYSFYWLTRFFILESYVKNDFSAVLFIYIFHYFELHWNNFKDSKGILRRL